MDARLLQLDDFDPRRPWSAGESASAMRRLERYGANSVRWILDAAEGAVLSTHLRELGEAERRWLDRSVDLESNLALYGLVDHRDYDGKTVLQRLLEDGWAPPAERAFLRALARAAKRVFEVLGHTGGRVRLRDLWNRKTTTVATPFHRSGTPLPPLLAGRLLDDGAEPFLFFDTLSFPLPYRSLLLRLAEPSACPDLADYLDAMPATPAARILVAWYHLVHFAHVLTWGSSPGPRTCRARFVVRGRQNLARRLSAAGFVRCGRNVWCDARSYPLHLGPLALLRRERSITLFGLNEAAVHEAALRLHAAIEDRLLPPSFRIVTNKNWQEGLGDEWLRSGFAVQ